MSEDYKKRYVPGQGELRFPAGMTDEAIDDVVARWSGRAVTTPQPGMGAGTPTPAPGAPDASTQAGGVNLDQPPPGGPYQPGNLKGTLEKMGAESSGLGKFGLGMLQSGARTARAVGLPQALRAIGVPMDPEGDTALDEVGEGTGWQGSAGNITGSVVQAAGIGRLLAGLTPAAVSALAAKHPAVAAYLASAAGGGATSAIMTPGGVGERAKEAGISAALSLPMTLAARTIAKPLQMSEAGRHIKAATGETPPVHIGAESKIVKDVGTFVRDLPAVGSPLVEGERRVFDAGLKQLWKQATPPGKPNLIEGGKQIKTGQLFQELKDQFDDTYARLLHNRRIPVTNLDRQSITRMIDNELIPSDSARIHKEMANRFPKGSFVGGKSWKELQEFVRHEASRYKSGGPVEQRIGDTYTKIDKHLMKMRNRALPKDVVRDLDLTDHAYASRKLLEKAISEPGGESGLTPKMLSKALRARTDDAAIARGHGTNQQLIYPMTEALGDLDTKNTSQAVWGLRRLLAPTLAAGLATGGSPVAMAAPALAVTGANVLGAGPRGAKVMFGETGVQQMLADYLRKNPQELAAIVSGMNASGQE